MKILIRRIMYSIICTGVCIHFSLDLADTVFRMKESLPTIALYSKAELMPPKPSEFGEVRQGIRNILSSFRSGAWKNLTVKVSYHDPLCNHQLPLIIYSLIYTGLHYFTGNFSEFVDCNRNSHVVFRRRSNR